MGGVEKTMLRFVALCLTVCLSASALAEEKPDFGADLKLDHTPEQEAAFDMQRMDLDKDGKISMDDLRKYMKEEHYGPEDLKDLTKTAREEDDEAKENEDEHHEPHPWKADGTLDVDKLVEKDAVDYMELMDANKDKFVSKEECLAHHKEHAGHEETQEVEDGAFAQDDEL